MQLSALIAVSKTKFHVSAEYLESKIYDLSFNFFGHFHTFNS